MNNNPHLPLTRRRSSDMDQQTIERTKKLSCWHILSVTMAIIATILAAMLLITNVTYYINEDHMVEQCTSDNSEHYYPCHYIDMIMAMIKSTVATASDYKFLLHVSYLATIVLSTHYIMASMIMMLGVATNKHLALIPWLIIQFVVALIFTALILFELYVDHYNLGGMIYVDHRHINTSRYFMVATAALGFVVLDWIIGYVTYVQIKKVNKTLDQMNRFDYARFEGETANN